MKRGGSLKRTGFKREREIRGTRGRPLKPGEYLDTAQTDWREVTTIVRGSVDFYRKRAPLKRGTPLRPVTQDTAKRKRRFARQYGSAAFVRWLKAQPCQLAGVPTDRTGRSCGTLPDRDAIECCHVLPKGAGYGVTLDNGTPNVFSGCPRHHEWQGVRSVARVARESGRSLWYLAAAQATQFAKEQGR